MINDERRLTDPHRPYQGICSPLLSPVVILLGWHNSVSPCGARGPCSNPAVLKCPRTGRSKNCRPVLSGLLGSFSVGPPGRTVANTGGLVANVSEDGDIDEKEGL